MDILENIMEDNGLAVPSINESFCLDGLRNLLAKKTKEFKEFAIESNQTTLSTENNKYIQEFLDENIFKKNNSEIMEIEEDSNSLSEDLEINNNNSNQNKIFEENSKNSSEEDLNENIINTTSTGNAKYLELLEMITNIDKKKNNIADDLNYAIERIKEFKIDDKRKDNLINDILTMKENSSVKINNLEDEINDQINKTFIKSPIEVKSYTFESNKQINIEILGNKNENFKYFEEKEQENFSLETKKIFKENFTEKEIESNKNNKNIIYTSEVKFDIISSNTSKDLNNKNKSLEDNTNSNNIINIYDKDIKNEENHINNLSENFCFEKVDRITNLKDYFLNNDTNNNFNNSNPNKINNNLLHSKKDNNVLNLDKIINNKESGIKKIFNLKKYKNIPNQVTNKNNYINISNNKHESGNLQNINIYNSTNYTNNNPDFTDNQQNSNFSNQEILTDIYKGNKVKLENSDEKKIPFLKKQKFIEDSNTEEDENNDLHPEPENLEKLNGKNKNKFNFMKKNHSHTNFLENRKNYIKDFGSSNLGKIKKYNNFTWNTNIKKYTNIKTENSLGFCLNSPNIVEDELISTTSPQTYNQNIQDFTSCLDDDKNKVLEDLFCKLSEFTTQDPKLQNILDIYKDKLNINTKKNWDVKENLNLNVNNSDNSVNSSCSTQKLVNHNKSPSKKTQDIISNLEITAGKVKIKFFVLIF